jgi:hypothetical protein
LRHLLRCKLKTVRAYLLKEAFQQLWEYSIALRTVVGPALPPPSRFMPLTVGTLSGLEVKPVEDHRSPAQRVGVSFRGQTKRGGDAVGGEEKVKARGPPRQSAPTPLK